MDTRLLYKKGTRYLLIPFGIAFCVILVLVFFLYAGFLRQVNDVFKNENFSRLMEISSKSALLVEERIKNNFTSLEHVSSAFYYSENLKSETIIEYLKKNVSGVGAIRLDLITPDGNAMVIDSNGNVNNVFLGHREYFLNSIEGKNDVQFYDSSIVDGQEVFVCSVPIFQYDGIGGVLIGVYDIFSLEKLLALDDYSESDVSFIVNSNGDFLTGRSFGKLSGLENNIFSFFSSEIFTNGYSLDSFLADIKDRKSGFTSITLNEQISLVSYFPLSLYDFYLLSFIPSETMTNVSKNVEHLTIFLGSLQMLFILIAGIFFAYVYRKNRSDLYDMAFIDSVTGGHNGTWFSYEAQQLLKKCDDSSYALVILDVDNLKTLNDTFGYESGNSILKYIYEIINALLVKDEIVARLIQDEFIILLKCHSRDVLQERLELLAARLNSYNSLVFGLNKKYIISMTAGICEIANPSMDFLYMEDRAYIALSRAKKMQGNMMRYAFFQEEDRQRLREEKRIENVMEEALVNGEFVVYIQPKYNIYTNTVSGAEALVRWIDPTRGMISPAQFIPLFEKNGFIYKLDLYVFEQVCKMIRSELDRGLEPHTVSVNLSRAYLNRPNFLEDFKLICRKYNVPPKYLELELTETVIFENIDLLIQIIADMHNFGFTCSIDDFGSGYSSLNILKSIPVDVLKLDREFFSDPEKTTDRGVSIIESIIELAQKLKMKTVSEGVEKEWQVDLLRKVKCDMVQGFIYSRPIPISDYEELAFEETV